MEESLKIGAVQKAEKRLCEEPFDRLRINSATKQSADFRHNTSRLLRFARNDMYFLDSPFAQDSGAMQTVSVGRR